MRKKFVFAAGIVLVVLAIAGYLLAAPRVVYRSDKVCVTEVSKLKDKVFSSYEWAPLDEGTVYGSIPVIVTGKVKNTREVKIEFTDPAGQAYTEHITLFELTVSEYLSNTSVSLSKDPVITVGYPFTSRNSAEGVPVIENGKEFLLFCMVPAEYTYEDPLCLAQYMDCWAYSPYYLTLEKTDGVYIADSFFADQLGQGQAIEAQDGSAAVKAVLSQRTEYGSILSGSYVVEAELMEQAIKQRVESFGQGVS